MHHHVWPLRLFLEALTRQVSILEAESKLHFFSKKNHLLLDPNSPSPNKTKQQELQIVFLVACIQLK